jgi:hypothetical protein
MLHNFVLCILPNLEVKISSFYWQFTYILHKYKKVRDKGKGRILPKTCHEDTDGEWKHSSSLSLSSSLNGSELLTPRVGCFTTGNNVRDHIVLLFLLLQLLILLFSSSSSSWVMIVYVASSNRKLRYCRNEPE